MAGLSRLSIKFRSEVLGRRIERVITAITGFRVVIGLAEMRHAQEHFLLPDMIFLELLEQVLRDPTRIFVDDRQHPQTYHLFYRLENGRYICAVVKAATSGHYFASMYPTGKTIRNTHKKLKELKP